MWHFVYALIITLPGTIGFFRPPRYVKLSFIVVVTHCLSCYVYKRACYESFKFYLNHPYNQEPIMHRCLEISELLTRIFLFTTGSRDVWPVRGSSTLLALALTCKTFSGPALDILWSFMPGLKPLIPCLPSDAIVRITEKDHINSALYGDPYNIIRDLEPVDFERMNSYTRRVKVFGVRSSREMIFRQKLPGSIALPLLLSRRGTTSSLFPNLHTLTVPFSGFNNQGLYLCLILGHGLGSITISIQRNLGSYPFDNLTAALMPLAPSLSKFVIDATKELFWLKPLNLGAPRDLFKLYRSFRNLATLEAPCISIDHTSLSHIATLPHLHTLSTSVSTEDLIAFTSTYANTLEFPSLSNLVLLVDNLEACAKLLRRSGFKCLKSLEISRSSENSYWDMNIFFKTIGTPPSLLVLSHLSLSTNVVGRTGPPAATSISAITGETLAPILSFTNLTSVEIRLRAHITLSDSDLRNMGVAWPHLKALNIYEKTICTVPKITLRGLLSLVASCPKLEELTLRVDALSPPLEFSQVKNLIPGKNLHTFDVRTSPIRTPQDVADFLIIAFPNLTNLYSGCIYGSGHGVEAEYYKCWAEVNSILKPITDSHRLLQYAE
ncbi:hypothetical protein BDZ94DRAFT_1266201 [Collybia nuda]|uniref:Uncharacterized protein n=1 Tax=Collybia nuda TaxID=64659 RepID=A0A9P6CGY6_9AGAR|nr:hypothetical protein BDZ94DRAFT_1266201 [Collybia nuda]